jgi:hypothetical protein
MIAFGKLGDDDALAPATHDNDRVHQPLVDS